MGRTDTKQQTSNERGCNKILFGHLFLWLQSVPNSNNGKCFPILLLACALFLIATFCPPIVLKTAFVTENSNFSKARRIHIPVTGIPGQIRAHCFLWHACIPYEGGAFVVSSLEGWRGLKQRSYSASFSGSLNYWQNCYTTAQKNPTVLLLPAPVLSLFFTRVFCCLLRSKKTPSIRPNYYFACLESAFLLASQLQMTVRLFESTSQQQCRRKRELILHLLAHRFAKFDLV